MHITFVKKKLADGSLCKKCRQVNEKLQQDRLSQYIDSIVIADVNDDNSLGMQLAREHHVARAPFFIVEDTDKTVIFDIYFAFRKYLQQRQSN